MNRSELVERCKRIIEEAYQEATEMIVAYLELHPDESEMGLCREIDPDNHLALRSRVQRLRQKRRSEGLSGSTISEPSESFRGAVRGAKSGIRRHPELVDELLKDPDVRSAVEKRIGVEPARYGDTVGAARDALADPEVAKDILRDDSTLLNVGRATQDLQEEEEAEARSVAQRRAPQSVKMGDLFELHAMLESARAKVRSAIRSANDIEWNDTDRALTREILDALKREVDWFETVMEAGTFDKELEKLLNE